MSAFSGVTHRPGSDGILGAAAACGADPSANVGGVLRMHETEFDCLVCLSCPDPRGPSGPCEGAAFVDQAAAIDAGFSAGFTSFRTYTCPTGHLHVDEAKFGGDDQ